MTLVSRNGKWCSDGVPVPLSIYTEVWERDGPRRGYAILIVRPDQTHLVGHVWPVLAGGSPDTDVAPIGHTGRALEPFLRSIFDYDGPIGDL